mmetsp:Transcript_14041/g.41318  ORF Transcript_14041/g.41318 Transcript_14041/m.41318 type:complete len:310 (-) Transcript_14041:76-1005(-)
MCLPCGSFLSCGCRTEGRSAVGGTRSRSVDCHRYHRRPPSRILLSTVIAALHTARPLSTTTASGCAVSQPTPQSMLTKDGSHRGVGLVHCAHQAGEEAEGFGPEVRERRADHADPKGAECGDECDREAVGRHVVVEEEEVADTGYHRRDAAKDARVPGAFVQHLPRATRSRRLLAVGALVGAEEGIKGLEGAEHDHDESNYLMFADKVAKEAKELHVDDGADEAGNLEHPAGVLQRGVEFKPRALLGAVPSAPTVGKDDSEGQEEEPRSGHEDEVQEEHSRGSLRFGGHFRGAGQRQRQAQDGAPEEGA